MKTTDSFRLKRTSARAAAAIFLVVFSLAPPARAGVDEDVLQRFFGEGRAAVSLAAGAGAVSSANADTLALRRAALEWDRLRPETRAALSAFLQKSAVDDRGAAQISCFNCCQNLIPSELRKSIRTAHFQIHYADDPSTVHAVDAVDVSPPNGLPDVVDALAETAERVYAKTSGAAPGGQNFSPPPSSDEGYPVYLCDLLGTVNKIFGRTFASEISGKTAKSFIEMDEDFANLDPGADFETRMDVMRVTFAHEYFHAVQFGMNYAYPSDWFLEATAVWEEDFVYPDNNDYVVQYMTGDRGWFNNADVSLDAFPAGSLHGYAASVFFKFLSEKIGGDGMLKEVWDRVESKSTPASVTEIPQVEAWLSEMGSSLDEVFRDFAKANYFRDYVDGALYSDPVREISSAGLSFPFNETDLSEKTQPADLTEVDHLSARYVRVVPPSGQSGRLTVSFQGQQSGNWSLETILEDGGGAAAAESVPLTSGAGQGAYSGFGSRYSSAVLILANRSKTQNNLAPKITVGFEAETPQTWTVPLQAGWNALAVPVLVPGSLKDAIAPAVSCSSLFAVVDGAPVACSSAAFPVNAAPGKGYWAYVDAAGNVEVDGFSPSPSIREIGLSEGWNLVGFPVAEGDVTYSDAAVGVRDLQTGTRVSLSEAVERGWVGGDIYPYESGGYSDPVRPNLGKTVPAWRAFWIRASRNVALVLLQS